MSETTADQGATEVAATIARAFHEAYEALAPNFGYRTREASAKPWADVPTQNKALMTATAQRLLDAGAIFLPKPDEVPGYWTVRTALTTTVSALQGLVMDDDEENAAKAAQALADVDKIMAGGVSDWLACAPAVEIAERIDETPGDGQWLSIAFMGHVELTGYVTEISLGGQPAFHVDLPEKLWGGNPMAWHEYAASALYSRRPVTEESVRSAWEAQRARAARRAREEAEWLAREQQRAIEAGDADTETEPF